MSPLWDDIQADFERDRRMRSRRRLRALLALACGVTALVLGWPYLSGQGTNIARAVARGHAIERVEAYAPILRRVGREFDLDPYLLAGIMYVESKGDLDAVSSVGALGLMQLSLAAAGDAAERLGLERPTREELLTDAGLNVRLAGRHLTWLFQNEGDDLERVLVAYNAGRTKIQRWIREAGSWETWRDQRAAEGDSQVLAYAANVVHWRERFRERGRIVQESD